MRVKHRADRICSRPVAATAARPAPNAAGAQDYVRGLSRIKRERDVELGNVIAHLSGADVWSGEVWRQPKSRKATIRRAGALLN